MADCINLIISNNLSTGMIWIYPCVLKPTVLVYNYIVEEEEKKYILSNDTWISKFSCHIYVCN